MSKVVTGRRELVAGYRPVSDDERVIRQCVMLAWVAAHLRRRGVARQLVAAAARQAQVATSGLASIHRLDEARGGAVI
jgi:hypothetical protein